MPAKTLFIVQQFDRVGKKIVAGRQKDQPSADAAHTRAEQDAARCTGVVANRILVVGRPAESR